MPRCSVCSFCLTTCNSARRQRLLPWRGSSEFYFQAPANTFVLCVINSNFYQWLCTILFFYVPSSCSLNSSSLFAVTYSRGILSEKFSEWKTLSHCMSSHWNAGLNEYESLASELVPLRTLKTFPPSLLASEWLMKSPGPLWLSLLSRCIGQKPSSNQLRQRRELISLYQGRAEVGLASGTAESSGPDRSSQFFSTSWDSVCVSFCKLGSFCMTATSFLDGRKITTHSHS